MAEQRRIYLASTNELKLSEARLVIPRLRPLKLHLDELQSLDVAEVVKHKLKQAIRPGKDAIIVEDTGLSITAWHGLPGPLIKWFVQQLTADRFAQLVLDGSDRTPAVARSAVGITCGGEYALWTGDVFGHVVRARGRDFGWIAIFEEESTGQTFGEMTDNRRLRVSMRRPPLEAAREWLTARGFVSP